MADDEPIGQDAPVCADCKQPKMRLPEPTEKKHEAVWVCVTKLPKAKMPCDGYVYNVAKANAGLD